MQIRRIQYARVPKIGMLNHNFDPEREHLVVTLDVDGYTSPPANGFLTIAWTASETGGAGIQEHEVWRAPDSGGSPGTFVLLIDDATSTEAHEPVDGTWWYGIHTIDNTGNCITEENTHCGGVSSDSLDATRTVRGPIEVIMLHNQQPSISIVTDSTKMICI